MFLSRNIAEAHIVAPSASMESADTTINVNGGSSNPPPPPEFRIPTRDTETTTRIPNQTHTDRVITTPGSRTSSTQHQLNWGGVLKGAAIVTGVVLVGVAAYFLVAPMVTAAFTNTALGAFANSVVATVGPALTWMGDVAVSSALYVAHFAESFAVALFGGAAGGAATGAATAASVGTLAAAPAVGSASGAVVGGVAMAASVPLAKSMLATTPMVDTVHVSSTTAPVMTGLEDGGAAANHSANTAAHTQASTAPHHGGHSQNAHGVDLSNAPDAPDLHEQMANMKTASKMAHHAAHESEGHSETGEAAAPEETRSRTSAALRNSARTSQIWAERVGNRQTTAVTPRSSQFSSELADERERLNQALGATQLG